MRTLSLTAVILAGAATAASAPAAAQLRSTAPGLGAFAARPRLAPGLGAVAARPRLAPGEGVRRGAPAAALATAAASRRLSQGAPRLVPARLGVAAPARSATPPARAWTPPARAEWTSAPGHPRVDRVNLYVHGALPDLRAAFARAGWTEAMPRNLRNNLRYGAAVARHTFVRAVNAATGLRLRAPGAERTIQRMPMSDQSLGRSDTAVALQRDNNPFGGRHHFRVFDTGAVDALGRRVWAIAASRDLRIALRPGQLLRLRSPVDHVVERNSDRERDTVASDALGTGLFEHLGTIAHGPDAPNDHLYSEDGRALELAVRPASAAPSISRSPGLTAPASR